MAVVTIRNKTNRPVMIRLNSGLTCYLGGGGTSGEIIDGEIANNHKLTRLQNRDVIEVIHVKKPAAVAPKTNKGTPKATKKKKANP